MHRGLLISVLVLLCAACVLLGACTADDDDDDSGPDDDLDDDDAAGDDDSGDDDDTADDDEAFIPPTPIYGYYEEAHRNNFDWLRAQLPTLAQYELTLLLGMTDEMLGDADLLAFLRDAETAGVAVRAWILLPYSEGYWPSEANAELFAEVALDYAQWFIDNQLAIEWIVVDMETSVNVIGDLTRMLQEGRYADALLVLIEHLDPQRFAQASEVYNQLNDELRAMGMRSMVVTAPMFLDDLFDQDCTIQDAMDIPVSTVEWDEVSTMVYTTTYNSTLGMDFGPDLVYSYARTTIEHYPHNASIALGISGEYEDYQTLADEVAASKAAGIERIQIYNFRGAQNRDDYEQWHQALYAEPEQPPEEGAVMVLRELLKLADLLF
ncbi:MAG: hypothetical protein P9M14_17385 [Candidatus Alcyoniella australis]|nr:hypothetical protein [Candidatus Alcyoniella australis]